MRFLQQSTVVKAFLARGWQQFRNGGQEYLLYQLYGNIYIWGSFDRGNLKLYDARIPQHSNFHLVSYWGRFRNKKELERALDVVEQVYGDLCGIHFPERDHDV